MWQISRNLATKINLLSDYFPPFLLTCTCCLTIFWKSTNNNPSTNSPNPIFIVLVRPYKLVQQHTHSSRQIQSILKQ